MKILLVGASGTLGSAVHAALSRDHEVLGASRSGQYRVDLNVPSSITALYETVGVVDAVACAAGVTPFRPLPDLELAEFRAGSKTSCWGKLSWSDKA